MQDYVQVGCESAKEKLKNTSFETNKKTDKHIYLTNNTKKNITYTEWFHYISKKS